MFGPIEQPSVPTNHATECTNPRKTLASRSKDHMVKIFAAIPFGHTASEVVSADF